MDSTSGLILSCSALTRAAPELVPPTVRQLSRGTSSLHANVAAVGESLKTALPSPRSPCDEYELVTPSLILVLYLFSALLRQTVTFVRGRVWKRPPSDTARMRCFSRTACRWANDSLVQIDLPVPSNRCVSNTPNLCELRAIGWLSFFNPVHSDTLLMSWIITYSFYFRCNVAAVHLNI